MSSVQRMGLPLGLIAVGVLVASVGVGCGIPVRSSSRAGEASSPVPTATLPASPMAALPPSATAVPTTEAEVSPTPAMPTAAAASPPGATATSPAPAATPAAAEARPFASLRFVTATTGWAMRAGPPGIESLSLWRTTDGGADWTDVTPAGEDAIRADEILDATTAWLAALHADGSVKVYRTVDGGRNWMSSLLTPAEVGQKDPNQPIGLEFVDARHGWLAVHGGLMWGGVAALFVTADGGKTWTRLGTNVEAISGLLGFQTETVGWATGERAGGALAATNPADQMHPGLLFVTRDGERTWQYQPLPLLADEDPTDFVQPAGPPQFSSDRDGIFPVLLHSGARHNQPAIEVYATHDAGRTWTTTTPLPLGTTGGETVSDFVGGRYGWVTDGNRLATTSDSGGHWSTFTPAGFPTGASAAAVQQLDFVNARVGWALVMTRRDPSATAVLKTQDGGHTWKVVAGSGTVPLAPTVHDYRALAFADVAHGCVAAQDGVSCTADGGRTWQEGAAGGVAVVQMQLVTETMGWAVAVEHPTPAPTPSAVAPGSPVPDVLLRTTDGGLHWQAIAHLAGLRSVSFADPEDGWAVTDPGLMATHDGGLSWSKLALPIGFDVEARTHGFGPLLRLADLVSQPVGWLVGDGGRVVGTSDGGTTWTTPWTPPFGGSWANGPAEIRFTGPRTGWLLLTLGQGCASQEGYALYHTTVGAHWALSFVGEGGCEPSYPSGFPFRGIGGYPRDLAVLGPDHAWLAEFSPASARLVIHATADGGRSWSQVGSIAGNFDLVAMQFVSDTEGWLITRRPGPAFPAEDDRLLHTVDGGTTWKPVSP